MAATVLLCDGSAFARDLFGDALAEAGWTVVGRVGTATEALERLTATRPQVFVTELVLPDREGFALLQAVRTAVPATRVVVCSALGDAAVRVAARACGAVQVLHKPLPPARLVEALAALAR